MAAVIHLYPSTAPSTRRPSEDERRGRLAHPANGSGARPQLRVVEGGRSPQALKMQRVFLLRRVAVVIAAALVAAVSVQVGGAVLREWTAASPRAAAAPLSSPYRVQEGDTLWGIARAVDPSSDPRDVVAQIARVNAADGIDLRAGALQVGQVLTLPS